MDRTSVIHIRWTEHPQFMVDGQNIPSTQEMASPKTDQAQTVTTYVRLELIFLLLLIQPSVKLRKTLIPLWRMRF